MTKIKFFKTNNNYFKIEATGHTGYAKSGEDILCASISSILQAGALGINKVLKISGLDKIITIGRCKNEDN